MTGRFVIEYLQLPGGEPFSPPKYLPPINQISWCTTDPARASRWETAAAAADCRETEELYMTRVVEIEPEAT